jgi:low affinity Fe/Cu permease
MSDDYSSAPVLLQYGPPAPPLSSMRETVGKVLTVLASVFGPPAAAVAAFVGIIVWSDCFIGCSGSPDHLRGGLLFVLAGVLLLAGPVLAATLVRKGTWIAAAVAAPFVEVGLLFLTHLGS